MPTNRALFDRLWNRCHILSWQQALLSFSLGLSLLLTNGEIVNDQLYRPLWPYRTHFPGLGLMLYGALYAYGLTARRPAIMAGCAVFATLLWSAFIWFFLNSPLHRIGAVTCGVLAVSQLYDVGAWVFYRHRVNVHQEKRRWQQMWLSIKRIEAGVQAWQVGQRIQTVDVLHTLLTPPRVYANRKEEQ